MKYALTKHIILKGSWHENSQLHYNMFAEIAYYGSKGEKKSWKFLGGKFLKRGSLSKCCKTRWLPAVKDGPWSWRKDHSCQWKDGLEADPENQYCCQSAFFLVNQRSIAKSPRKSPRKDTLSYHLIYSSANYKLTVYYQFLNKHIYY